MKDEIKNLYKQDNYIRSMLPYRRYFDALEQVLDFSIIESFIDIGCNNGRLIEAIKRRRGNVMVAGIDIFKWAQECADPLVKDQIKLIDLSQKQNWDKQYDIVNCTEVGEHLEKESEQVFLDNIVGLTKDILIVTWSNTKNDQHFNPRPKKYIIKELEKRDLTYCVDLTKIFKNSLEDCLLNVGYQWWAEDIMIFKRLKFYNSGYPN
ncbi:MAG: class I SAM-dependent methyltransferase [Candidatus Falkowbacteria bacterium]|nr:class I SAM-dependent methyltransferase [Candidatus Falkowbacteria bacterium]